MFPTAVPTARGRRRVAADAAAVRTSPTAFAAAVADGIGDNGAAASAARFAVAEAVEVAWHSGVAARALVRTARDDNAAAVVADLR